MKAQLIEGKKKDLGDGLQVSRLLPYRDHKMIGPFIFFDHMGPVEFQKGKGIDVRPHPHIGLATVTFLFEGSIRHRDSLGCVQDIVPGDVNLMTAGKGIVHSERSSPEVRAAGGPLEGLQIWIALPTHEEEREPEFFHYAKEELPLHAEGQAQIRILMGQAFGRVSPVKTYSPTFYLECQLPRGESLELAQLGAEAGIYLVKGALKVSENHSLSQGEMFALSYESAFRVTATEDSRFAFFGGEPVGQRLIWWNFVASSQEKIEAAKQKWQQGGFDKVPEESEFIPLPEN